MLSAYYMPEQGKQLNIHLLLNSYYSKTGYHPMQDGNTEAQEGKLNQVIQDTKHL